MTEKEKQLRGEEFLNSDKEIGAAKARARVIEHPEGGSRVAALVGRRIDGTMRVTEKTGRILIVELI